MSGASEEGQKKIDKGEDHQNGAEEEERKKVREEEKIKTKKTARQQRPAVPVVSSVPHLYFLPLDITVIVSLRGGSSGFLVVRMKLPLGGLT